MGASFLIYNGHNTRKKHNNLHAHLGDYIYVQKWECMKNWNELETLFIHALVLVLEDWKLRV